MYKKVSASVNDQISGILQKAFEDALYEVNIVLTRPERKRLPSQITHMVMEDILKK